MYYYNRKAHGIKWTNSRNCNIAPEIVEKTAGDKSFDDAMELLMNLSEVSFLYT